MARVPGRTTTTFENGSGSMPSHRGAVWQWVPLRNRLSFPLEAVQSTSGEAWAQLP